MAEDKTTEKIYLYTANGQTAGYVPFVKASQNVTQLKQWAWDNDLRVYEIVPDDPQQMFGSDDNRTYYYVRGRREPGEKRRYIPVGREEYYFNKHPFYAKPAERHLLIQDA